MKYKFTEIYRTLLTFPAQAGSKAYIVFSKLSILFLCRIIFYSTNLFQLTEFSLIGNARALTANRISFYFGFQGPSANINNLCTSSASALEKGFFAIKNGEVEGAVICGGNLSLYPQLSLHLQNLGVKIYNFFVIRNSEITKFYYVIIE